VGALVGKKKQEKSRVSQRNSGSRRFGENGNSARGKRECLAALRLAWKRIPKEITYEPSTRDVRQQNGKQSMKREGGGTYSERETNNPGLGETSQVQLGGGRVGATKTGGNKPHSP